MIETLEKTTYNCDKLIKSIISKFNYQDKDDLYQVGRLGLIKAYNNFDETKGVLFTSYAYMYILGEVKKYIRENKLIKVNRQTNSLYIKINKAKDYLTQKLMKEVSNEEIALFLEVPTELVEHASKINNNIESLDQENDENISKYDKIMVSNKEIDTIILLKEKISKLNLEDQKIILSRYYKGMTQQETANNIGLSQVKVYRKEQKILSVLRQELVKNGNN